MRHLDSAHDTSIQPARFNRITCLLALLLDHTWPLKAICSGCLTSMSHQFESLWSRRSMPGPSLMCRVPWAQKRANLNTSIGNLNTSLDSKRQDFLGFFQLGAAKRAQLSTATLRFLRDLTSLSYSTLKEGASAKKSFWHGTCVFAMKNTLSWNKAGTKRYTSKKHLKTPEMFSLT